MKRMFLSLLALTTLLAGPTWAADLPELTMAFFVFGQPMKDMDLVQAEVNKIAAAKIGATVKLMPVSIGAWTQQANLMLASGEKLDLIVTGTGGSNFAAQVSRNQLLPLDDYLSKVGAGIKAAIAPEFLGAAKVRGKTYAVPTVRDYAAGLGFNMRKSILDKHKIDPKSLKTYADVEKVLRLIKEKEPQLAPLMPGVVGQSLVDYLYTWDTLGDRFGVLPETGKTLKVVNLFEHPDYVKAVNTVRGWYQSGLVLKDASTNKDTWVSLVRADKIFAVATTLKPGIDAQTSKEAGETMVTIPMIAPQSTTSNVINIMWAVPRNSRNPEKAVAFLNLMYSDPAIINLLDWGIEGRHYVKTPAGVLDYPAGVTSDNTGYGLAMGWLFGNQLMSSVWKGDSPTLYKDMEAFNTAAVKSKALGFVFDATPVKTEYAAVTNVYNQYKLGVENGLLDPAEILPAMNQKLRAAGLDKILAEKQKQLDAWVADNK